MQVSNSEGRIWFLSGPGFVRGGAASTKNAKQGDREGDRLAAATSYCFLAAVEGLLLFFANSARNFAAIIG
jgi:hypothetical protein